jgi:hypothetical protein
MAYASWPPRLCLDQVAHPVWILRLPWFQNECPRGSSLRFLQLGRARERPTGSKFKKTHPGAGDKMMASVLFPGQAIATDQYESRIHGRVPLSRGSLH